MDLPTYALPFASVYSKVVQAIELLIEEAISIVDTKMLPSVLNLIIASLGYFI